MHRRKWLSGTTAALATFHIVPRHVLGGPGYIAPSDKINLAIVGAGGRGRQVLRGMMAEPDVRVVAVADPAESFSLQDFYYKDVGGREPTRQLIDQNYLPQEAGFKCSAYENFEEMLSEQPDIDAILCGTPDHLHAYVSVKSLQAGKHVYCEKPLTHNLWEARHVAQLAKEKGLATQMGNQGHSTEGMRETCEWIWSGAIGQVREVKAWVSGHRWNPTLVGKPQTASPAPAGLNWNLWLGPREARDFEPAYFPVAWRDFWAFGNSNIGDFGCHDLDAACWALNLPSPDYVEFVPAGPCNEEIGPHGCIGYFQFAATADRPAIKVTWYDGGLKPERPAGWPARDPLPGRGVLFIGDEGSLFCGGAGGAPQLLPASRMVNFTKPPVSIRRVKSHQRDFLDACKGGEAAGSNFSYGARLTELALLGALSLRTNSAIEWNSSELLASNLPSASSIIKEKYRNGWEIE
jgi:predicted dehydrogenase